MTVTIRPATRADVPEITRIYAHSVEHGTASFELSAPDEAEMTRRFNELTAHGFPYLVAVVDGAVVGYAYAGPYRTRPAYRFTVENSVYVAKDRMRQGIGVKLLSALIRECEAGPWRQMLAVIGNSENESSIALHSRLGFRHIGVLKSVGYKLGRWVDTVIMQRPLGVSDSLPPTDIG